MIRKHSSAHRPGETSPTQDVKIRGSTSLPPPRVSVQGGVYGGGGGYLTRSKFKTGRDFKAVRMGWTHPICMIPGRSKAARVMANRDWRLLRLGTHPRLQIGGAPSACPPRQLLDFTGPQKGTWRNVVLRSPRFARVRVGTNHTLSHREDNQLSQRPPKRNRRRLRQSRLLCLACTTSRDMGVLPAYILAHFPSITYDIYCIISNGLTVGGGGVSDLAVQHR